MHALVEVVAGLPVAPDDVLGHRARSGTCATSSRNSWSSSDSSTREKSIRSSLRPSRAATMSRDAAWRVAPGSPPASGQPLARTRYARRGRLGRDAESALHVHGHRGRLGGFLGHEHEDRRRQLRPLVGLVVEEPGGAAGQVAAALHRDGHVGQRMRDAPAASRSAPRGCSGSWRTRRRSSSSPRRARPAPRAVSSRHSSSARWYSASASAPLASTVRLSAAAGSTHAIGSLPMLSTRAGRVANVSRTTSSPSRTMMWSATDPAGISRTPRRTVAAADPVPTICSPLTIGLRRSSAPSRASSRAAHTWSIHGTGASYRPISSATSVRSTRRRPVATDGLRQRHRRCTHGAQAFPQALVESGCLGRPDRFDRAVALKNFL